jgi:hypothetical protein
MLALIREPNTGTNHMAVLSTEARTVYDTGSDSPQPGHRSGSRSARFRTVCACGRTVRDSVEGLLCREET